LEQHGNPRTVVSVS